MPRTPDGARARNVETVWLRVRRHPDGITESEIARRTGFERRTVHNYLIELQDEGKIDKEGTLWFANPYEETRIQALHLSPEEAYALYLGSRLLTKQHDKRNEPAESALLKLAEVLTSDAGVGQEIAQAAQLLAQRPSRPEYQSVFTTLTRAYIYRRTVELVYRPLHGRSFTTRFRTYLMEPSPIGYTTYAIGHSSTPDALRAYKLERIQEARMLREPYQIPADFPGLEILTNAWSIYFGEETIEVVLRFSPNVRERVLETQWHPSQCTEEDGERPGWLRWRAQVADTTDMLPWIRGWGAQVEVISPYELREKLEDDVHHMISLYSNLQSLSSPAPLHSLLWAKTTPGGQTHSLLYHMIDVGQVALALWQNVLGESFRREMARTLGIGIEDAGRLLAFWTALHDLGKASPYFQCKFVPGMDTLKAAGVRFPVRFGTTPCFHAVLTALTLPELLRTHSAIPEVLARQVAQALGGHHGSWPTSDLIKGHRRQVGDDQWAELRNSLVQDLIEVFDPPPLSEGPIDQQSINRFLVVFSGMVTVADWLGSIQNYFPPTSTRLSLADYAARAQRRATYVLENEKWTLQPGNLPEAGFENLFGFDPKPIQQHILEHMPEPETAAMIIIEAPTGIGKTEMAIALADRWMVGQGQRGFYVAMPTQATSNQMFGRVGQYLQTRYPNRDINYHLIHSQAMWRDDLIDLQPLTIEGGEDVSPGNLIGASWFLPRKRTLLAPFAVGTVDQALLSVLQSRHFFVRLFGLSHKTIIFDEVHAYDTYMSSLFQHLLRWLRVVGASVVILSATLPKQTRKALVKAYLGTDLEQSPSSIDQNSITYPAMTIAGPAGVTTLALPTDETRTVEIGWLDPTVEAMIAELRTRLTDGGCVAIICNRVARAQEVYQELRNAELIEPEDLLLFHARFPQERRNEIEQQVVTKFGKGGNARPKRAILIATQVIEQSLDLDFDYMITDLAPIDLILQRMGRLHRHSRDSRPFQVSKPVLSIFSPQFNENGVPDWGGDGYVYEPYILFRSLLSLQRMDSTIAIPEDTQKLIEAVYDTSGNEPPVITAPNSSPLWQAALETAKQKMHETQQKAEFEAERRLIEKSEEEGLLWRYNELLAEESPDIHKSLQALTRLIEPTVSLVCLHHFEGGLSISKHESEAIALDTPPDARQTRMLAQQVVSVSHPAVRNYFSNQEPPKGWRKHSLLNTHRVAVFQDGECILEGTHYRLLLSDELGLQIVRDSSKSN